jgi:hypothetical protein
LALAIATGVVCLVAGALLGSGGHAGGRLGMALLVLIAGTAAILLHPRFIYSALAVVLGALPFGILPGFGQPLLLVLAFAVWCALLTHPIAETRTNWLELAVGLLVVTSVVSLVMTAHGIRDGIEFIKWILATSMVFALLRLDRDELRRFGRLFVFSAWAAAVFALGVFFLDKAANSLNYLSIIGYGRTGAVGTHLRFYTVEDTVAIRLTGTYVDPNAAGIFMLVAVALSVPLLRGWQRAMVTPVLVAALIISLSRAAIFSFLVAVLLFLLFQRQSTGKRLAIFAATIVGSAAAMAVPAIYKRIMTSFSLADKGSTDRAAGYAEYFYYMKGGWWFGLGWGRPEFIQDDLAYKTNHVANSPLLTVYRGGIFTGIAFLLVMIVGAVYAYRQARRGPWESGAIGAIFTGFALVGLQLDFPVVTLPPLTMVWSVLIAFLAAGPISPAEPFPDAESGSDEVSRSNHVLASPRGGGAAVV